MNSRSEQIMKYLLPLALLIPLVFISGCSFINPGGVFGADVINVETRVVEESVRDPVIIRDIVLLPKSPVIPNDVVTLTFVVENVDKVRPVYNVYVDLYNAPGFKNTNGVLCNSAIDTCLPDVDYSCSRNSKCDLLPGEQRQIIYTIYAPSKTAISSIKTETRLDFRVLYDFTGYMNFVVPAVNKKEVIRRQQEGETMDMVFEKSFSSGPIRIDVDPLGVNYLLDNLETVFFFKVQNIGSGNLLNTQVEAYGLTISVPGELEVNTEGTFNTYFEYSSDSPTGEGYIGYTNRIPIQVYRDETQVSLRFPITLASGPYGEMVSGRIPFRSYQIKAQVAYTYELRGSLDITVNPFENF